jgi:hypothetical protein
METFSCEQVQFLSETRPRWRSRDIPAPLPKSLKMKPFDDAAYTMAAVSATIALYRALVKRGVLSRDEAVRVILDEAVSRAIQAGDPEIHRRQALAERGVEPLASRLQGHDLDRHRRPIHTKLSACVARSRCALPCQIHLTLTKQ